MSQYLGERPSLTRALDKRKVDEADLSTWNFVRPEGRRLNIVAHPVTGQLDTVPSLAGLDTWRPGSKVLIAQPQGKARTILGKPAAGSGGSAAFPPRSYPPGPPPVDMIAYVFHDSFLYAMDYRGGAYVRDRGRLAGASPGSRYSLIRTDSSGKVGAGSLVYLSPTGAQIFVADIGGGELYSYDVPAGWIVGGAGYVDGMVWWIEREEGPDGGNLADYRLVQSPADLSDASVVGAPFSVAGGADFTWVEPSGFFLTTGSAILVDGWIEGGSDKATSHFTRLPRAGGDGAASFPGSDSDPWLDVETGLDAVGIPGPDGASWFCASGEAGAYMRRILDDVTLPPEPAWPLDSNWLAPDGNASISDDLARGSLYTPGVLVRNPALAIGAEPADRLTVEAHPSLGILPSLMFLRG